MSYSDAVSTQHNAITGVSVGHRVARILVLASTMAVLAGEYYVWREHAADPGGLIFLAALYIGYAITVESLTTRFAWSPATAALFGIFVGTALEGFFQRSFMADEPRLLGVNWLTVAIMWLYWGGLTTALARYAADRILPRASYAPPGSRRGLVALAAWWALLLLVWGANLGPLPDSGVVATAVLTIAVLLLLAKVGRRRSDGTSHPWRGSAAIDVALLCYVAIEVLVGTAVEAAETRIGIWIVSGAVVGIIGMAGLLRRESGTATLEQD